MVKAKSWVMTQHFDGFPKKSDFGLKVEELPEPKDGGTSFFFLSTGEHLLQFLSNIKHRAL